MCLWLPVDLLSHRAEGCGERHTHTLSPLSLPHTASHLRCSIYLAHLHSQVPILLWLDKYQNASTIYCAFQALYGCKVLGYTKSSRIVHMDKNQELRGVLNVVTFVKCKQDKLWTFLLQLVVCVWSHLCNCLCNYSCQKLIGHRLSFVLGHTPSLIAVTVC